MVPRNVDEYGIVMGSRDETLLPLFHAAHSRDLQHDPPTSLSEPHWGGGEIPRGLEGCSGAVSNLARSAPLLRAKHGGQVLYSSILLPSLAL